MMKKRIITIILATILFGLSFLYTKNEICCMFSPTRYQGWPFSVEISKQTWNYNEATKIYSSSTMSLLAQGWQVRQDFDTPVGPYIILAFNFIFYFMFSNFIVFAFGKMKSLRKK